LDEISPNPPGFGERVKLLWQGSGYSLRQLAELTDVNHQTIKNWADGKGQASLDQVAKLAAFFGWTVEELYYGKGDAETLRRLAELEAFRRRAERLAKDLLGIERIGDATGRADDEGPALPARRAK
jgi:transcriptional regulator with XRE-family HTH domain